MDVKVLRPGDKIDLRLLKQIENSKKKASQDEISVYKSQIYDIQEDGKIQIAIPTQGGRMVRFPVGTRLEAVFYSNNSLYMANLEVTAMIKEDGLFVLQGELINELLKYQRRQFYRLDKIIDLNYYLVEETEEDTTSEEGYLSHQYEEVVVEPDELFPATSLNISGGGMKLVTQQKLEKKQRIMLEFSLELEDKSDIFHLLAEVVECIKIEGMHSKYVTRVQFLLLSESQQKRIIRYIFSEERRQLRGKGRGL